MADVTIKDYVSLKRMEDYTGFVKSYVGGKVASSVKSIAFNEHTKVLSFYTDETVSELSVPIKEVTIPDTDVSNLLSKIADGTEGDVVAVGAGGTVVDSGVKVSDLATKQDVATAAAGHLKKVITTEEDLNALIAEPSTADADTIYLLKDETVTGEDKYKEYTLINGAIVCIGSTSTSLEGLVTTEDLTNATSRISALEEKVGDGFTEVTTEQIQALWDEA